jgi:hypothetical protein
MTMPVTDILIPGQPPNQNKRIVFGSPAAREIAEEDRKMRMLARDIEDHIADAADLIRRLNDDVLDATDENLEERLQALEDAEAELSRLEEIQRLWGEADQ